MIADTFMEMAQGLETGSFGKRPKVALTGMGSEHGEENSMKAAVEAAKDGIDVYYIGTLEAEGVTTIKVANDEEGHDRMEEMLKNGEVDAAVTMHFPFPIGVSTVGRCVTPATAKEMFIANTTGTSSTDRIEGMIKNAIYGIITAKACGTKNPTVGILNVDGARQTEKALKQLQEKGYDIAFAESGRADGGCVMRGNDVLQASPDIMVTDSLTGNILVKMLSSFNTGGSFEATGYGYGPGIGEGYEQLVMIVSRASGAPVIANAIRYAGQLVHEKKDIFSEGFVYQNKQAVTLEKGEFPKVSRFITQTLGSVNNLYANRIEVSPCDRKKFLLPFAHLCYDRDSPFNIKGPKFFSEWLFLAVKFKKSDDSDESLSVEEIDCEIQRLKRTFLDD